MEVHKDKTNMGDRTRTKKAAIVKTPLDNEPMTISKDTSSSLIN